MSAGKEIRRGLLRTLLDVYDRSSTQPLELTALHSVLDSGVTDREDCIVLTTPNLSRRALVASFGAAAASLWIPGEKLISIPKIDFQYRTPSCDICAKVLAESVRNTEEWLAADLLRAWFNPRSRRVEVTPVLPSEFYRNPIE